VLCESLSPCNPALQMSSNSLRSGVSPLSYQVQCPLTVPYQALANCITNPMMSLL
jgi:hypothetical protein